MDISFIVNLGLPVLILTGSLHRMIANAGLGKRNAVLFFVLAAVLALLPDIHVAGGVWLRPAGVWYCIAPALYLALNKAYTFRFFIVFLLAALFGMLFAFAQSAYAAPYISAIAGVLISLAAILGGGRRAAVFAPVLAGVFFAVRGSAAAVMDMAQRIILFGDIGMVALSTAACLFAAYIVYRPRGRHERKRRSGGEHPAGDLEGTG